MHVTNNQSGKVKLIYGLQNNITTWSSIIQTYQNKKMTNKLLQVQKLLGLELTKHIEFSKWHNTRNKKHTMYFKYTKIDGLR